MRATLARIVRSAIRRAGFELVRRPPENRRSLGSLLRLYGVDMLFDVGANAGMTGKGLRGIGYEGQIVSFEPVAHLYEALAQAALGDAKWKCENVALGEAAGECEINVTGTHGGASSFLTMTEELKKRAPDQCIVGRERVPVRTLDEYAQRFYPAGDGLFLKLDVQGYERNVLAGAQSCIDRVVGMKIELSIARQYEGEPLIGEMLPLLYGLGFRLVAMETAWSDPVTQEILQVDGVLFRTDRMVRA